MNVPRDPVKRRIARFVRLAMRSTVARFQPSTTFEVPNEDPNHVERLITDAGIPVERWNVPAAGYREYISRAGYPDWFLGGPTGGDPVFGQRTLEHFVALALTNPSPTDVLVDVGSNASPFIDAVSRVVGCTVYEQDLQFPPGVEGSRIGGSAAAMSVGEAFADVLVLSSAFVCFEGDADTGFVREAARVLRPGGRAVILPFYVSDRYGAKVDPCEPWKGSPTDADMIRYLVPGLRMTFSRLYDPARLRSRVLAPAAGVGLEATVLRVVGGEELVPYSYVNFALLLRRPSAS